MISKRISQDGVQMNPLNENQAITLDDIHKILVEFQKIYSTEGNRDTVIESDSTGVVDGLLDKNIPRCGHFLAEKWRRSNLRRYFKGDVKSNEIDPMINTFALVFALFLTIVPNYAFNLSDGSTLTYLQDNIAVCNIDGTDNFWYTLFYIPVWNMTVCALYMNMLGLGLICCYFILRPSGTKHFQSWFRNCGILFLCVLLLVFFIAMTTTLLPVLYYEFWLAIASGDLCSQVEVVKIHGSSALISRYRNYCIVAGLTFSIPIFVIFQMV